jgi:ADP-ribose pyrophosphatase
MPSHEQTIRSERAFDGKLLHVRIDHVRLPSGRESVREVIEHPGAVGILALTPAREVILIRQWRHAVGVELLEIPAGTRETGESAEVTARRELREETGYEAGSLEPIARYFSSAGFSDEQMSLFLARDCTPVERDRNPAEVTEVVLVTAADLPALLPPANARVRDAKTLVALTWLAFRGIPGTHVGPG